MQITSNFHVEQFPAVLKNCPILFLLLLLHCPIIHANEVPMLWQFKTLTKQSEKDIKRQKKPISLNLSLLRPGNPQGRKLKLLLPDKTLTIIQKSTIERLDNDFMWSGYLEGNYFNAIIFTVANGILYGSFIQDGHKYEIRKIPNGDYAIFITQGTQIRPDSEVPVFTTNIPGDSDVAQFGKLALVPDAQLLVDVLMLYTAQMLTEHGAGLNAYLQNLLDIVNVAFSQSGVNGQLNLLPSQQIAPALEAVLGENIPISSALTTLKNNTAIDLIRGDAGADLVSLIRAYQGTNSCGRAGYGYTSGPGGSKTLLAAYGYSVIETGRWDIGNGSYYFCDDNTFAHETGHNLGATHDRDHTSSSGLFNYSYGYDVATEFATIMSYDNPEILFFSTPDKLHNGIPIGLPEGHSQAADNVSTINLTFPDVAEFRESQSGSSENVCTGSDPIINNTIYDTSNPVLCSADNSITVGPSVIINSIADVTFSAPVVRLLPGFYAQGQFHAGNIAVAAEINIAQSPAMTNHAKASKNNHLYPILPPLQAAVRINHTELPAALIDLLARQGMEIAALHNLIMDVDRRVVIFSTAENLLSNDQNGVSDIYRYEIAAQQLQLISSNAFAQAGNAASDYPAMDGFGERIVFQSAASDLTKNDHNNNSDIFLYDGINQPLVRISSSSQKPSAHPAIQANGRAVFFDQFDTQEFRQIYRYHVSTEVIDQLSLEKNTQYTRLDNHHPAVSADGNQLVYIEESDSGNEPPCQIHYYQLSTQQYEKLVCPDRLIDASELAQPYFGNNDMEIIWLNYETDETIITRLR